MRFSVGFFTPAKEVVQGEVLGRRDGQVDLFFRCNTVVPPSDDRILKDKKKQMMTVRDSIVGDRCPGQLSR